MQGAFTQLTPMALGGMGIGAYLTLASGFVFAASAWALLTIYVSFGRVKRAAAASAGSLA